MQAKIPSRRCRHAATPTAFLCGALALLLLSLAMATTANAAHHRKPVKLSGAAAFALPSAKQCLSGGELSLHWNRIPRVRWSRALVSVDGHRFATISQWTPVVRITGLPSGTFRLSITGLSTDWRRATASGAFHSCATHQNPEGGGGSGPESGSSGPTGPSSPEPGSYNVQNAGPYYQGFSFYVSPDGTKLEDISGTPGGNCTPGGSFYEPFFYIAEIAIEPDGSFSATKTEQGIEEGAPATFTFTFSGHFQSGAFSGSYREDVAYNTGVSHSCTSGLVSWTASRTSQGSQAPASAQPGHYNVGNSGAYYHEFSFYVSPDGSKLEDVSGTPGGNCTPGGSYYEPFFHMPEIAIEPDGSFSATETEQGIEEGAAATFTFTFSGHFHGTNSSGQGRAAGVLREDVTYANGTQYTCMSNGIPWSATHDSKAGQPSGQPAPGTYQVGNYGAYYLGFSFKVSSDGTRLLDVSGNPGGRCSPGASFSHQFYIAEIAVSGDGSFTATSSEAGQVSGHAATFTYTFSGHFHGFDSSGKTLAAGVLVEELTYANGVTYTCSSNVVPWSATSS